ncbi:MAG: response regulator [Paracoccaceae bacterium]
MTRPTGAAGGRSGPRSGSPGDPAGSGGPAGPGSTVPTSVLIVEDNAFIALDLEAELTDLGWRVVGIAATAGRAVEMARAHRPALAVVDLQLADGSRGQDAAAAMRAQFGVRSVLVSGSLHRLTAADRAAIEPVALLSKPLLPHELVAALAAFAASDG